MNRSLVFLGCGLLASPAFAVLVGSENGPYKGNAVLARDGRITELRCEPNREPNQTTCNQEKYSLEIARFSAFVTEELNKFVTDQNRKNAIEKDRLVKKDPSVQALSARLADVEKEEKALLATLAPMGAENERLKTEREDVQKNLDLVVRELQSRPDQPLLKAERERLEKKLGDNTEKTKQLAENRNKQTSALTATRLVRNQLHADLVKLSAETATKVDSPELTQGLATVAAAGKRKESIDEALNAAVVTGNAFVRSNAKLEPGFAAVLHALSVHHWKLTASEISRPVQLSGTMEINGEATKKGAQCRRYERTSPRMNLVEGRNIEKESLAGVRSGASYLCKAKESEFADQYRKFTFRRDVATPEGCRYRHHSSVSQADIQEARAAVCKRSDALAWMTSRPHSPSVF